MESFPRSTVIMKPIFFLILLAISAVRSHQITESRKLDSIEQSKCGGCPCGNPCPTVYSSPPPPPPPPAYYTPLPPPPPPPRKTPSTSGRGYYCPPPPANYIYITGPPGNLYPIDQTNGAAASRRFEAATWVAGVVASLLLFHYQF